MMEVIGKDFGETGRANITPQTECDGTFVLP